MWSSICSISIMRTKHRKIPWFDKKTFVVTGGSSGIGLAISRQLSREGAKVIAVSFNPLEFPVAQAQLDQDQQSIDFFKCDITSSIDRDALKQYIMGKERSLAGVINAAGITTYGPFFQTPVKALQKLADVNFTGTMLFIREIFPLVLQDQPSETKYVGFISSTSGGSAMANLGGYPATKAGVEMFLRCLELECPKNVKILAIRPGPVKTNLYNNVPSAPDYNIQDLLESSTKMQVLPEKVASVFIKALRKKRGGIIYPNFGTRIMVKALGSKFIAKMMAKGMKYMAAMKK